MVARRRAVDAIMPEGLGADEELAVILFRLAGERGMSRRELRERFGKTWPKLLGRLRAQGYAFHTHPSQFGGTFRWVLAREPWVPLAERDTPAAEEPEPAAPSPQLRLLNGGPS